MRGNFVRALVTGMVSMFGISGALAQDFPWEVFADTESTSVCDLINAENAELVLLQSTGELVIVAADGVNTTDVILEDTFVDLDNNVFYFGDPVGFITFATDGDGFRTLWWLDLTGRVVSVDTFTGEPFTTDLIPDDFVDVSCDACPDIDFTNACDVPVDPPFVTFVGNAADGFVTTSSSVVVIQGIVDASDLIVAVDWVADDGASGACAGAESWSCTVPVVVGENLITVIATDAGGLVGESDVLVTRTEPGGSGGSPRLNFCSTGMLWWVATLAGLVSVKLISRRRLH